MKIVIDLSTTELSGAVGPDGTVWGFPDADNRNTVQNVFFQKLAIGQMALLKATQENRPDLDDFILYVGETSIRLLQVLLEDKNGDPPSEEEAAKLCAAGFVNRLMALQAEGREVPAGEPVASKTADQMIEEIDLDEVKASFARPTLVEADPTSTE